MRLCGSRTRRPSKACEASGPSRKRLPCIIELMSSSSASDRGTLQNRVYAPMWVEDQAAVEGLRSERSVAEALALYHRIDVLVVGIGSWHPPESCLCAAFPSAWHDQALAAGVTADLCATLLDDEGRAVANPLDQLGLGITAEQLRRIPDIVGIGGGLEKAAAIASVLRGGWISTLVTDAGVARRL